LPPAYYPRLLTAGNSPLIGGTRGGPVTVAHIPLRGPAGIREEVWNCEL